LLKASRNCVTSITDSTYLRVSDRRRASEALAARTAHLKEKLVKLEEELAKLAAYEKQMLATPDSRSRSPIPIVARWQAAVAAQA